MGKVSFSMGGEGALFARSVKVAMVGRGPFVVWMTALYVGRTDTMSARSETSKVPSKRKALMMLLLKLFRGLMIPASIACRPGNTSGRFAVALGLVSCIDTAPIA